MIHPTLKGPLFALGQVVITHGANEALGGLANAFDLLLRHMSGDDGEHDQEDKESNQEAVEHGYRILSSYNLPCGTVWIITEADRASTTILLPSEY